MSDAHGGPPRSKAEARERALQRARERLRSAEPAPRPQPTVPATTRRCLALYALDDAALATYGAELARLLREDDRAALRALAGSAWGALAPTVDAVPSLVDLCLAATESAEARGLFAVLRAGAAQRALQACWRSEAPSLEGRLRQFPALEADPEAMRCIDALLDDSTVPWFLRRDGMTAGRATGAQRQRLVAALEVHRRALPAEVIAFVDALDALEGDCLVHEGMQDP